MPVFVIFYLHIRHLLLFTFTFVFMYIWRYFVFVNKNLITASYFFFKAHCIVCFVLKFRKLLLRKNNFLWGAFFFAIIFLSDLFVRGENFIFIWNMCVPFPFLRKNETKNSLFLHIMRYLLCKRFRRKFTIYCFIMILAKKNCDIYCTLLVNIFCIEGW